MVWACVITYENYLLPRVFLFLLKEKRKRRYKWHLTIRFLNSKSKAFSGESACVFNDASKWVTILKANWCDLFVGILNRWSTKIWAFCFGLSLSVLSKFEWVLIVPTLPYPTFSNVIFITCLPTTSHFSLFLIFIQIRRFLFFFS